MSDASRDTDEGPDASSPEGLPTRPEELFAMFAEAGIEVVTVNHPPLFTVEDSRALRGQIDGGHIKNLFLKDKKGNVFLVVAEEDAVIDLKRIHTRIGGQGRVSFGRADLLMELLGVRPGAVTPFALINDADNTIKFVLDEALLRHDVINCHPLVNTMTTSIGRDDLLAFLKGLGHEPNIVSLASQDPAA